MLSLFDQTDTVDIQPMSEREAAAWEMGVGNSAHQLRLLLFEGYQRRVWEALGHATWSDCLRAIAEKYEFSERHMWRLHSANETEKLLTHGSVGVISERVLRPLVALDPERQVEVYDRAVDTAPNGKVTAAHVQRVVDEYEGQAEELAADEDAYDWTDEEPLKPAIPAQPAEYDSDEWFTPVEFIEAARAVMGSIDLDPASSHEAQKVVQASAYYTQEIDGLEQEWHGNVWLNPPYSAPRPWVEKLIESLEAGSVNSAILLVNTANSPLWTRPLWHGPYSVCLLERRVRFWRPDRPDAKGFDRDQMIWYLGHDFHRFNAVFEVYGAIR